MKSRLLSSVRVEKLKISVIVMLFMVLGTGFTANAVEYGIDKNVSTVKWVAKKVTGQHNGLISFESGSVARIH